MILDEAPSEKIQHTWYSRLSQERRELSASVEEALVNTPLEERFWLDDQSQHATTVDNGKRSNVFPPRLSLQSRSLPGNPYPVGTGLVNTQGNTVEPTSIWARFAQRLTSLFAPFRFQSSVAVNHASIPIDHVNVPIQPKQEEDTICPRGGTSGPSVSHVFPATTHEVAAGLPRLPHEGLPRLPHELFPRLPFNLSDNRYNARHEVPRSTQGRQRLGGRTTRIRLEVVPAPSSETIPNKEKMTFPDIAALANKGGTSYHLPAIEKVTKRPVEGRTFVNHARGITSVRLPAIEKVARRPVEDRPFLDGARGATSTCLATVEKVARRREEPVPAWRTGTGMFECGQRDITISDPSVTASSVVLVTLTSNPGPVVVQYVSLQPRIGFTVHLTAPTTMGASFNYVIL